MIVLIAVFGLLIGSFAAVIAHRIPRGESPLGGRSRCDGCGAPVLARDNVPVLSWLLLRGRCRSCGARIPVIYPLAELGTAVAFVGAYLALRGDGAWWVVLGLVFTTVLVIISLTDLDRRVIPNLITAPAAVAAVALVAIADGGELPAHLIAGAAAGGGLLVVSLLYPRGMGMGDVKLAAVIGLFLGRAVAPALLIGFFLGALYGVALIARHGAAARKRAVPFGPFLALGGYVGLIAGEGIVDWYLDSFTG